MTIYDQLYKVAEELATLSVDTARRMGRTLPGDSVVTYNGNRWAVEENGEGAGELSREDAIRIVTENLLGGYDDDPQYWQD